MAGYYRFESELVLNLTDLVHRHCLADSPYRFRSLRKFPIDAPGQPFSFADRPVENEI